MLLGSLGRWSGAFGGGEAGVDFDRQIPLGLSGGRWGWREVDAGDGGDVEGRDDDGWGVNWQFAGFLGVEVVAADFAEFAVLGIMGCAAVGTRDCGGAWGGRCAAASFDAGSAD